jgi:hypothetical protein
LATGKLRPGTAITPGPTASAQPSGPTMTARPLVLSPEVSEAVVVPVAGPPSNKRPGTMLFFNYDLYENRESDWHENDVVIASDHGESRIQFLMSLKYELLQYSPDFWNSRWAYYPQGLNLAYDGLYDFYWFSRASSPVVSRTQNPGIFLHFLPRKNIRFFNADFLDAGWFHESNGQTTTNIAQYNALYATEGDHAQDSVHRGWDYWYLGSKFTYLPFDDLEVRSAQAITKAHQLFTFLPSFRFYDGHQGVAGAVSENVFWKPVGFQPYIYDYDGIRAAFTWETIFPDATFMHFHYVALGAEFRTGYNAGFFAANWSKKFTLTFKTGYFPWYVYYSNGYGPYISDYSTWSQGWGMGIRLW